MKKRSMRWTLGAGLLGTLLAASCAGPKMIKLADGSKVQAAGSYLSPEAMKARGKNAFGVPEASFAFYPKGYVPAAKDVGNYTAAESEAFRQAAKKEGRQILCYGFVPSSAPEWDGSYCDLPGTRHDCFRVEQLYVIPWGWEGEGIGMKRPGTEPKDYVGYRWMPWVSFDKEKSQLLIWDSSCERLYRYDDTGRRVQDEADPGAEKFSFLLNADGCDAISVGDCKVYLPRLDLDFRIGDERYKITAPQVMYDPVGGRIWLAGSQGGWDKVGRRYYAYVNTEGIFILRYSLK